MHKMHLKASSNNYAPVSMSITLDLSLSQLPTLEKRDAIHEDWNLEILVKE